TRVVFPGSTCAIIAMFLIFCIRQSCFIFFEGAKVNKIFENQALILISVLAIFLSPVTNRPLLAAQISARMSCACLRHAGGRQSKCYIVLTALPAAADEGIR